MREIYKLNIPEYLGITEIQSLMVIILLILSAVVMLGILNVIGIMINEMKIKGKNDKKRVQSRNF